MDEDDLGEAVDGLGGRPGEGVDEGGGVAGPARGRPARRRGAGRAGW
ncbi:hypothetical protein LUX05_12470 [Streptomyces somaliensis]|nr:hypothetical protein [Streptomyces somaliensis]